MSESDAFVFVSLMEQMAQVISKNARASFSTLAKGLASADPRAWLTGEAGISVTGPSKPIAVLFCLKDMDVNAAVGDDHADLLCDSHRGLEGMLAAVYALDVYGRARRMFDPRKGDASVVARRRELHALFAFDEDTQTQQARAWVGEAGSPDPEPLYSVLDVDALCARALATPWLSSDTVDEYAAVLRYATVVHGWEGGCGLGLQRRMDSLRKANPLDVHRVFNREGTAETHGLALATALAQALRCDSEEARVNKETRVATGVLTTGNEDCAQELRGVFRELEAKAWEAAVSEKRRKEAANAFQEAARALEVCAYDTFITRISELRSETTLFDFILSVLLDPESALECVDVLPKLWTLATGRHWDEVGALPCAETVVWGAGNKYTGKHLQKLAAVFKAAKITEASQQSVWDSFCAIRNKHVYRLCGQRTSKGHGNDNPSYWALGYPTLDAYKSAVGEDSEEWTAYKATHVGCCGLRDLKAPKTRIRGKF